MKVVLRHKVTGRYYNTGGEWMRRADNALAFDDVKTARAYSKEHRIDNAQPVQRFAPYVMNLLESSRHAAASINSRMRA